MLGDFPLTLGFGVSSSILKKINADPFANIRSFLKDCDICFGNLETILSDCGLSEFNIASSQMRGRPCFVKLLKDAGFSTMSLANNHAMQHGPEAFTETKKMLIQNFITPLGLADANGRVQPVFFYIKGIRVCFLAYSQRPEKYASSSLYAQSEVSQIIEDIKNSKKICDIVILSLHWGDEFVQIPSSEQISNAHSFVDAGVSLLIGHHPHVIQGIETYKKGLIAYSLGNFVFDFWQKKMRETIILHCNLSKDGVESFYVSPVIIDKNYSPTLLMGNERNKLLFKLNSLSEKIIKTDFSCEKQKNKYQVEVNRSLKINQIENRLFFLSNLFKYERWVVRQSLLNFIKSNVI